MAEHVLITGGAGFIGSHVADHMLARGHRVRALDNLDPQVHGPERRRPAPLAAAGARCGGGVRDPAAVRSALRGVDAVYHFAAMVGVGQSMYRIDDYTDVNARGTAVLLQALSQRPVRRVVVASSMSVYGEGLYRTKDGRPVTAAARSLDRLRRAEWEPAGEDGAPLEPVPTTEDKPPALESVYALSKYDQERLALLVGRAYGIPTVALRFFNVFGPRQALSNPYTGVLAIFAARLKGGAPPLIFEDGLQRRDFVSVHDVARAAVLALDAEAAAGHVVNVGSGHARTVREVAARMAEAVGRPEIAPEITGRYRMGDVRHCFADVRRARTLLGFEPAVRFEDGIAELAAWRDGCEVTDRVQEASAELAAKGLTL